MKLKILSVVTIILAVLWCSNVKAATYNGYIYEDTKIPGIYFYKHREDTATEKFEYHNFHSEAAIHRRSSDNAIVYCIESWKTLTGSKVGDFEETTDEFSTKLSVDQINKIKKLAYFGYGYQDEKYNHNDLKWYAITQYLIWLVQAPNIEHYFVNSISSTAPLNIYDEEINELNRLVDSIPIKMNMGYNDFIMYGKAKTIKIDNLDKYEITASKSLKLKTDYDTNSLEVTPLSGRDCSLTLRKRNNRTGKKFTYYLSDKYQNTMSIGDLDDQVINYNFKIETGTIEIKPFEEDNQTKEHIPLTDCMYGVFTEEDIYINGIKVRGKDELVASSTPRDGVVSMRGLSVGKYYVKELWYMGNNYYDYNKVFSVTIKDKTPVGKELYYHRQKLRLNLKKYLSMPVVNSQKLDYSLQTREGIKFGLFDEKSNLILEESSDKDGIITFDLSIPYGNYFVKEISTLDNYYLSDFLLPIEFVCNGTDEYQIIGETYEIINYPKKGEMEIIKVDETTKAPLIGVQFAIYNEKKEMLASYLTDENGKINLTLPYGNYYLKELSTLDNYELNDQFIPFSITSDKEKLEITNKQLEETIEKGSVNPVDLEIKIPNSEYKPLEVELSKTDDYNVINLVFYFLSLISLILFIYEEKIRS